MIGRIAAIAAGYATLGWLAGFLAIAPGYASPVWPAAGLALVAVTVWGPTVALGVFLGSFAVNLQIGLGTGVHPLPIAALVAGAIAVGAAIQAVAGAWLAARVLGPGNPLERGVSVPLFLLLTGPLASAINTSWGTACLLLAGYTSPSEAPASLLTWWVGDTIGVITFAPLLYAWRATPREHRARRWGGLAVPVVACMAGVIGLFFEASRAAEDDLRAAFEQEAHAVFVALTQALDRAAAYTESVARAFGVFDPTRRSDFRMLVSPWLAANPSIEAFEWAPQVAAADLPAFELRARDAEVPDFAVWELRPDGTPAPVTRRGWHAPLLFVEPLPRERGAVGYDLASNPERHRALEAARDSGGVVVTEGVRLVLFPSEWGVLVIAASYGGVAPPEGVEERRAGTRGYLATVLRVDELVADARARAGGGHLAVRVTDVTPDTPRVLTGVTETPSDAVLWASAHGFGGRTWAVDVWSTTRPRSWAGFGVLALGLGATGLVVAFVLDAGARAVQIERLVAERTHALEKLNAALLRSNADLQRFAYVASHDMREPLRTITSFAEVLERDLGPRLDAAEASALARIIRAARRMQSLVTELLDFARLERRVDVFERVDLGEVARAALDDLSAVAEGCDAEVIVGPLPVVRGDRVQLVQVFENLLSNALKFRRPGVRPRIEIAGRRTNTGFEVTVRDNGIGFEPRHAERVFEMFQTVHAGGCYPGSGIGLATCRRIVERHGGRIWVESDPALGSAFRFTLEEHP